LFGKTRQGYYKLNKQRYKEALSDDLMLAVVRKIRENQKRLGGRKLLEIVKQKIPKEHQVGRDEFYSFLRRHGLLVRRRKYKAVTTDSFHWLHKYPNMIRELKPLRPNHIWVSDITYIKTGQGFVYLFLITDAYSRKIIGWHLSDNLGSDNAIQALYMAISQLPANIKETIHHSDRGIQYCSSKYVKLLGTHDIKIRMTENGDPYENAIAERVNGILKTEWLYDMHLHSFVQANVAIKEIIKIYNSQRPHSSLGMLTPNQAHSQTGELKRLWKSYKKIRKSQSIEDEVENAIINNLVN
jgi:putative transposase